MTSYNVECDGPRQVFPRYRMVSGGGVRTVSDSAPRSQEVACHIDRYYVVTHIENLPRCLQMVINSYLKFEYRRALKSKSANKQPQTNHLLKSVESQLVCLVVFIGLYS